MQVFAKFLQFLGLLAFAKIFGAEQNASGAPEFRVPSSEFRVRVATSESGWQHPSQGGNIRLLRVATSDF